MKGVRYNSVIAERIERIMAYLLYTMKYAEFRVLCSNSKGIHGLLLN